MRMSTSTTGMPIFLARVITGAAYLPFHGEGHQSHSAPDVNYDCISSAYDEFRTNPKKKQKNGE